MTGVFQGIGSLFGSLVNVDLDVRPVHVDHIEMRQHGGHVFNISKLVLAFESDRRELSSEPEALHAERPPDESASDVVRVPCRVETKLIFDDPRIDRVEKLDIGEMSLFVLHEEARDIPFGGVYPKCKLRMVRGGSEVEIVGSEYWSRSDPPIRYERLEDLNGRPSHVPKMRMVAQAHDYRRRAFGDALSGATARRDLLGRTDLLLFRRDLPEPVLDRPAQPSQGRYAAAQDLVASGAGKGRQGH